MCVCVCVQACGHGIFLLLIPGVFVDIPEDHAEQDPVTPILCWRGIIALDAIAFIYFLSLKCSPYNTSNEKYTKVK